MRVIFLIHAKTDHKHVLLMVTVIFHGDLLSKQFLPLPQIIQRLLQYMKRAVNVFD